MFHPDLHAQLVEVHVAELRRNARTASGGRGGTRPTLQSTLMSRIFAGRSTVKNIATSLFGFDLVGPGAVPTLRPRT